MSILKAINLAKSFGKRQVVKDVSFAINQGEIVGILGPNGAGKTTCFYMVVGLIRPSKGFIFIDNEDITSLPIDKRSAYGISYLPQEASIFRKLTTMQNIMAILELRRDLKKSQRRAKLEELLREFNLEKVRDSLGISLSGGERRRVEIARALALDPKFILLDEPFAGIDPISIIEIKNMMKYLQTKNVGILITDHNVKDTLDICQKAFIVYDGGVIEKGSPDEILKSDNVRRIYLGADFSL